MNALSFPAIPDCGALRDRPILRMASRADLGHTFADDHLCRLLVAADVVTFHSPGYIFPRNPLTLRTVAHVNGHSNNEVIPRSSQTRFLPRMKG